jgi:hypothetical protein
MSANVAMKELEGSKQTGRFTTSPGKEISGDLTLAGSKTSLYLHDNEFFDTHAIPNRCITGVLHDRAKVSLIDCITTSGTGSGSRGDDRYHFANLFPHFVVYGDHHITPDQKTITEIDFVIDDATTLFYDFDAFGSVIDARPYIEQIAHANGLDREIKTGPDPQILYFTGKREIFVADTVWGKVSASHSPSHTLGGPSGVRLENTIFVTVALENAITFRDAVLRTGTLLSYFGMLVGRPQNLVKLGLLIASSPEKPVFLRVYWSMPPRRERLHEEENPHPADVLLDAVRQPETFSNVLANWLERHRAWHEARSRFFESFADQHYYSIDRLIGAANMFDILPNSAVPPDVELSEELKAAKEAGRKSFRALPQSLERDSVLGAMGRMGKSGLKHKIRHRAGWLIGASGKHFPELVTVCDEAVNCRNYYVHGNDPRFDYSANPAARVFFTDTLEFMFAASDLIEAGWDVETWSRRGSSMSNQFARYHINYALGLNELKALLPRDETS